MSGPILDLGTVLTCPHGGHASPVTVNTRVLVNGLPVLVATSTGQCLTAERVPAGLPIPSGVQPRVIAQ